MLDQPVVFDVQGELILAVINALIGVALFHFLDKALVSRRTGSLCPLAETATRPGTQIPTEKRCQFQNIVPVVITKKPTIFTVHLNGLVLAKSEFTEVRTE